MTVTTEHTLLPLLYA